MKQLFIAANVMTSIICSDTFILKLRNLLLISVPLSMSSWILSKVYTWTISNSDFIAGVLTCIAIDHILGTIYHATKLKDFSIKKNVYGLVGKLFLCGCSAVLFEIIHSTIQESSLIYEYLKSVTRLVVILYPASSAFYNMSAITNGKFPPLAWLKKLKAFNQNLDIESLNK